MVMIDEGIAPLAAADVAPGVDAAIARADEIVDAALAQPPDASFDDVFGRIDHAGRLIAQAYGRYGFPSRVHPDEDVRDAATEAVERFERWSGALALRRGIGALVSRFVGRPTELDAEQKRLLDRWVADVQASGMQLDNAAQARLAELREVLLGAPARFFPALLRPIEVTITADELDGIPTGVLELLGEPDASGTWTVALTDPIVNGVLEGATNRGLRERVARGWLRRGLPETTEVMQDASAARREIATLLGRKSWMEVQAPRLAAGDPEHVERFIAEVEGPLRDRAAIELAAMREVLIEDTGDPRAVVQEWDWRYLDARQRAATGIDAQALRDYLPFEDVLAGLMRLSEAVFGVRVEPRPERAAWHPDVRGYDLLDRDTGAFIAELYVDPFAREGKAGGAWMDAIDPGDPDAFGPARRRVIVLGTNAPAPGLAPSTLGFVEVDQLFHEYGHVLDYALDRSRYWWVSEAWIEHDWVEGPSLFLGRWGQHPAVLGTFARHVTTGQPIPPSELAGLVRLESLNAAVRALRYLSMARLDQLMHGADPIGALEADREAWLVRGIPYPEETSFLGTFVHLVSGYDAAIYGFLWDQALRDDIFTAFGDDLLSPEVGARYREDVLSAPWTEHPLEGLQRFLGRSWSSRAFLDRIDA